MWFFRLFFCLTRSRVLVPVHERDLYGHLGGIFACMGPADGPAQASAIRGAYHTSLACAGKHWQMGILMYKSRRIRPISPAPERLEQKTTTRSAFTCTSQTCTSRHREMDLFPFSFWLNVLYLHRKIRNHDVNHCSHIAWVVSFPSS